jgi:hypothetical protein
MSGDYLYIMGGGIYSVDISDPLNPVETCFLPHYLINPDHAIGECSFKIQGDYGYLKTDACILVLDLTDPLDITLLSEIVIENQWWYRDLDVHGDYLYISKMREGLIIYDISDPTDPVEIGVYNNDDDPYFMAYDFEIQDSTLYLLTSTGMGTTLHVLSLADPEEPVLIDSYEGQIPWVADFVFADPFLYLVRSYIFKFNISDPENISYIGPWLENTGYYVAMEGNILYMPNDWNFDILMDTTDLEEYSVFETSETIPRNYSISSVYPNPFNPVITAVIELPQTSDLRVAIYNLLGQEVGVLAEGNYRGGYHRFSFKTQNQSSGIYFIQASVTGKMNDIRKIVLIK